MMTDLKPNKFAGMCQCGAKVEPGAGYWAGITYCQKPNELNRCPIEQARLSANAHEMERHRTEVWLATQKDAPTGRGMCGKCDGTGKYIFYNGINGICYPCNGTGVIK
jgi:hypothetical protein